MSLLLCRRERVKHPFYIEVLGIHIYSSQELCYVIYHHPLLVMNDFADASLFSFIKNELGLGFLAGRLEKLIEEGGKMCIRDRVLDAPQTAAENVIQLAASGWGYAEVQVEADGSFLSIEKNAVTTHEFDQDRYQIRYQIFPQYLQGGRNFGAIRIKTCLLYKSRCV